LDLKSKAEDKVLTIQELADYLKLSLSSAYKLAQRGIIPGQKVGKHWRFHRGAIDRWLQQNPNRRRRGGDS
jgi:excisionase family DNA binding protein